MKLSLSLFLRILTLTFCLENLFIVGASSSKTPSEMVEKVEKHLLAMFGFKTKPRPNPSKVEIHPYMMELYKFAARQNGQKIDEEDSVQRNHSIPKSESVFHNEILANTVRSFTQTVDDIVEDSPSHYTVLRFNLSSIPSSEIQRAAELRFFHSIHPSAPPTRHEKGPNPPRKSKYTVNDIVHLHRIKIFDIIRPSRKSVGPIRKFLAASVVDAREKGSVSIDVSEALKRWAKNPRTNNGLYVEVVPFRKGVSYLYKNASHVRLRRDVSQINIESVPIEEPLLVVHTDDGNAKPRVKRSSYAYKREGSLCQKYDMYVDFKSVEWSNWIVAPKGYHAYFCQGQCPFPLADHMNVTNHAVIQNIVHSRTPSRVKGACCVPVDHSAISILYIDEYNRVVLKNYQDMVVESCGCR